MAVFIVEDQESMLIDDIKRQFAYKGYLTTYNEQGEVFTYDPKSISITTIDSEMNLETKVSGYDY